MVHGRTAHSTTDVFPAPDKGASRKPSSYTTTTSAPSPAADFEEGLTAQIERGMTNVQESIGISTLPLRKRSQLPFPTPDSPESSIDALGNARRLADSSVTTRYYKVNKALPPIPPDEQSQRLHLHSHAQLTQVVLAPQAEAELFKLEESSSSRSTSALAHAALGIGLPHVMPQLSVAATSSGVRFPPSDPSSSATSVPPYFVPKLKKSKSVVKLRTAGPPEIRTTGDGWTSGVERKRGVSFGSYGVLSLSGVKGKQKTESSPEIFHKSPVLMRKSSFWRRKNNAAVDQISASTTQNISPINSSSPTDLTPTSNKSMKDLELRLRHKSLTRSHSERSILRRPSKLGSTPASFAYTLNPTQPAQLLTANNASQLENLNNSRDDTKPITHTFDNISDLKDPNVPLPRPRAHTASTPLLLHRLSLNWFGSPVPIPSPDLRSDLPALSSSGKTHVETKATIAVPKPLIDHESPQEYLCRLHAYANKSKITGILASSPEPFYAEALSSFIKEFDFVGDPLDMALRKLLMEVGLPKETQQIDRVMEAFAAHYLNCNPGLFVSKDHPYILAFSLIMLHTDAFNKSNRKKMSKADYLKNTRLPGVPSEVLDCFYDNILFSPFIFVEGLNWEPDQVARHTLASNSPPATKPNGHGSSLITRTNKVDPYFLITNKLLGSLRIDVETIIPAENPFRYGDVAGVLHDVHASAVTNTSAHPSGLLSSVLPTSTQSGDSELGCLPKPQRDQAIIMKVGLLNRKDDLLAGGRKSPNRKWRSWNVILTDSELIFCPPSATAFDLTRPVDNDVNHLLLSNLKPDDTFLLENTVAVIDASYKKHDFTFRFAMADGRQVLLQASDREDLGDWMTTINYASSFITAGIALNSGDASVNGKQRASSARGSVHGSTTCTEFPLADQEAPQVRFDPSCHSLSGVAPSVAERPTSSTVARAVEGGRISSPDAAQGGAALAIATDSDQGTVGDTQFDTHATSRSPCTRRKFGPLIHTPDIHSKITHLDALIASAQEQLDTKLRFVRNIAILTPLQKAGRDRLLGAVLGVTKSIRDLRLDMSKFACHRAILASGWMQVRSSFADPGRITRCCAREVGTHTRPIRESPPHLTASSPNSSFHSLLDLGTDWLSSDGLSSKLLDASQDTPRTSTSASIAPDPHPDAAARCDDDVGELYIVELPVS